MTPEELDEARAKEAYRQAPGERANIDIVRIAARLAREGWQPPEPVDPDLLAAREWMASRVIAEPLKKTVVEGLYDHSSDIRAYLAGCTRGRGGTKGLVEALENASGLLDTPVGLRRHAGDSFYDDVIASIRAALTSAKRGG